MEYTDPTLFDRVPVRMTLTTAQKYMNKLKCAQGSSSNKPKGRRGAAAYAAYGFEAELYGTTATGSTIDFTSASTLKPTSDSFVSHIQERIATAREARDKRFVVSYDIIVLKDALFAKNAERGISQILSQIDFINAQLADLKSLLSSSALAVQTSDIDMITLLYKMNNMGSITVAKPVTVAVYSQVELKKLIKNLTKTLTELEEKRDKLNATSHITIPLSSFSRAELGLNDDDDVADK
jgi:hypothetical protein